MSSSYETSLKGRVSIDLPDVNVWVALASPDHPHHRRAVTYWRNEVDGSVSFITQTALGLVRLLTNSAVRGTAVLDVQGAWQLYRAWRQDPAVTFTHEPARCQIELDRYVVAGCVRPRTWSDAYLAAFARSAEMRLVSFDADFAGFSGIDWLHLRG